MTLGKARHIITDEDIKRNRVLSEKKYPSGIVKNALIHHSNDNAPKLGNKKNSAEAQAIAPYTISAPNASGMFSMKPNINQGMAGDHIAKMNSRLDDIEDMLIDMVAEHVYLTDRPASLHK